MTGRTGSTSSVNLDLQSPPSSNIAIPTSVFYSTSTCNQPSTPPPRVSNPTSTLVSNKTSGSYTYASEIYDRDSANYHLTLETSSLFLGAMPPKLFLDKFLLISQDAPKCPTSTGAFASVGGKKKEVNMYTPFISMVLILHGHASLTCDRSLQ